MKKFLKRSLLLLAVLAVVLAFTGCAREPAGPTTYTVWWFSMSADDYNDAFSSSLGDGYWERFTLNDAGYSALRTDLSNANIQPKIYTEADIKKWCKDEGFGEEKSTEATSWFIAGEKRIISSRTENRVQCLLR